MQSAANHSPTFSSLLNRELTGNFGVFGPKMSLARSKRAGSTKGFPQIPYSTEQGILIIEQGIFSAKQGIFREEQGTYRSRIFAVERKFESAKEVGPLGEWTGRRRVNNTGERLPSKSVALAEQECAHHLGTAHAGR